MKSTVAGIFALGFLLATSLASAQAPNKLSFQGRLTNSGGVPINNPTQSMTFALYKGATKIWHETQSVAVTEGLYNVLLGSVVPVDTIKFNRPIQLGVQVGADPEMTPRTILAASATARSLPGLYTAYFATASDTGFNVVGGAPTNTISPSVKSVTLFGGIKSAGAGADFSNSITASYSTVSGGIGNRANHLYTTIGGGQRNQTIGEWSTIGGGYGNYTEGTTSVIAGGSLNRAYGDKSFVPGGFSNIAYGAYSFAGGWKARAKHDGTFVWNDFSLTSGNDSLLSTAANQFIVRASGGFGINRAPANIGIHLKQRGTNSNAGVRIEYSSDSDYWDTYIDSQNDYNFSFNGTLQGYIRDTDGVYVVFSDASLKEDILPYGSVLPGLLELHPSTYRFKTAEAASERSLGLIAQEVEPLFPELVTEKDGLKGMNYSGLSVVAVKAIQELYALVQQQQVRLDQQEAELAQLRQAASSR